MWVSVPIGYRSAWPGSSTVASFCVNTPTSLPPAMASSMSLMEVSRATASGMKEFGNSTVSRNGRTGTSAGTTYDRSAPCWTRVASSLMCDSFLPSLDAGWPVRDRAGPAPAEPARRNAEVRRLVQVHQEAGRTSLRHLTLASLRQFAGLLAVLAAHRKRQRAQSSLRDLVAALEAVAVRALFEARQRFFNLVQRLRLHLDQREFDVVLDVGFGGLRRVQHALAFARRALGAHVAHLDLNLVQDLATTLLENALQLGVAIPRHHLGPRLLPSGLHP